MLLGITYLKQFTIILCVIFRMKIFETSPCRNLTKMMEIAYSMEAADRNVQKLKSNKLNLQVSEISLGINKKPCYCCGSKHHRPRDCPYKEAECRSCIKKSHLVRMHQSRSRARHKNQEQSLVRVEAHQKERLNR